MDSANTEQNTYGMIAKTLHWGFVAIFVYGVIKQIDNIAQLQDRALLNFEMVFAAVFLGLLGLRFLYMRGVNVSTLPDRTPIWQRWAAKIVHYGMYGSMGLIAASGLLIGLTVYAGIEGGVIGSIAVGLHEISVQATYWLIGAHILAAVYHRLLNDGVWSSMVPVWTEKPRD